ncbi:hypothetical protein [Streptomyces clavuligerus]|uniref:hypothetical protein n=1 Tax=Streptomyces clavuligerus TaxID=1901 RepID=UPI001F085664|nr:hypothetical protein [Streptomyces clavuligerus]
MGGSLPRTPSRNIWKSVFDKTGVRSRRDLVAALFTRHTEPALLKTATADGVTGRTGLL